MPTAGVVYVDVRGDTVKFSSDIDAAARKAERSLAGITARGARSVLNDLGGVATAAARGVALVGGAAIAASTDFNKSMSGVAAVAGATAAEMDLLRQAAIDAGAATAFGASDAAVAQAELVKAGVSVADVLGGALSGSLDLAAAGQLELGNAAEISAQAMNIFGLAGDDVAHIADVMAAGANKSAADVKGLGDALRQGGLVAAQVGLDLEDTVGVLSLFSDNALVGSDAGTSLKTMLQRLAPQSKEAEKAMAAVGLEFFNAQGEFVGIEEAAQRLQDSLSGLSEEQRLTEMTTIFGADAIRAANLLYQSGADGVREYVDAVDDQGAAQRMAAEQLNNLAGDVEEFSGSAETALISLGNVMDPVLRSLTQGGTDTLNVFNDFAASDAFGAIEDNVTNLGAIGAEAFEEMADAFTDMLGGITASDVNEFFYRAAAGAEELAESMEGLGGLAAGVGAALASMGARSVLGPFAAIVPHIGLVTGAISGLLLGSEQGRDALADLGEAVTSAGVDALPSLTAALQSVAPPLTELLVSGIELAAVVLPDIITAAAGVAEVAGPTLGAALGAAADVIGIVADNADYAVPALAGLATVIAGMKLNAFITAAGGVAVAIKTIGTSAATAAGTGGLASLATFLTGPFGIAALGAGLVVGGLTKHFLDNRREAAEAQAAAEGYASAIDEAGSVAEGARTHFADMLSDAGAEGEGWATDLLETMEGLGVSVDDVSESLAAGGDEAQGMIDALKRQSAEAAFTSDEYSNLADAQKAYDEMLQLTGSDALENADAISKLGIELGLAESASNDFENSLEDQVEAIAEGARQQKLMEDVMRSARSETDRMADALDGLTAAQDRNAGKEKSLNDARAEAATAMRRFNETNLAAKGSMDLNTEAGLANFEAVRKMLAANKEFALAQLAVDGNSENASRALSGLNQVVRNLADEGKASEEQVNSLLVELGLLDEADIEATIKDQEITDATERAEELKDRLDTIDDAETRAELETLLRDGDLTELERRLDRLQGSTVRVNVIPVVGTAVTGGGVGGSAVASELRGIGRADGGIRSMADQAAQIAPGGADFVWWAEEETHGEAFIPFAPSKRDKSVKIWQEAGKHLGVMPMADGGISAAQELRNQQTRNQLEFVVDLAVERGDLAFFEKLAAGSVAWSDDWVRWLEQINTIRERAHEQRKAQEAEQKQNMIEYKAARVEGQEAIAFFEEQRKQFTPWTNEWVKWTERIEKEEKALADERKRAAEELKKEKQRQREERARAEAEIRNAREDAPTITIENMNVSKGVSLAEQIRTAQILAEPVPVA